ncbi:MAG: Unknown protein [uncultured Campylobacterales bacterium]|uniref:CopG family transcriptional regulator n=1 Tax=uncultured Campylobacterales bacterium TaxID=352960 RepID=A0A6S6STI3_9BACT|nr:MAG: Unknown protein [uncultured Campylobacterales bacterium]
MYKNVKPVTFTLPFDLIDDIDNIALSLKKKKTTIVKEALEMYLDYQDLKIAESRLTDGDDEVIESEDFFNEL